MGVYINMEMPTSCATCKLFGEYGCPFIGAVGYALTRGERNEDCPLVPVPPHGRLIDADALEMERRAENAKKGWHDSFAVIFNGDPYYEAIYDCTEQFKELVNNAPTIIPVEGNLQSDSTNANNSEVIANSTAEEEIADLCTKGHLHLGYAEEAE